MAAKKVILKANNLSEYFYLNKHDTLKAVDQVSFDVYEGETLGIVGESGCGKTTLGRSLLQLYKPTAGEVIYYGKKVYEMCPKYYFDTITNLPKVKAHIVALEQKLASLKEKFARDSKNPVNINARRKAAEKADAYLIKSKKIQEDTWEKYQVWIECDSFFVIKRIPKASIDIERQEAQIEVLEQELKNYEPDAAGHLPERFYKQSNYLEKLKEDTEKKIKLVRDHVVDNHVDLNFKLLYAVCKEKVVALKLEKKARKIDDYINYTHFKNKIKKLEAKIEKTKDLVAASVGSLLLASDLAKASSLLVEFVKNPNADNIKKEIEALKKTIPDSAEAKRYEALYEEGINLVRLTNKELNSLRKDLQFIFQDPYSSLDPRMTVREIIREGMQNHNLYANKKADQTAEVMKLLEVVGLNKDHADRFPHEFSGGQRQRVGIARALALNPKIIVCDEPTSALDVSIQAQVVNLLKRLQKEKALTYIFIAHNISLVKYISDRIIVMYLGKIVEIAPADEIFANYVHPYTEALMSAIPIPDPIVENTRQKIKLEGEIPSPINTSDSGCMFRKRCPYATEACATKKMNLKEIKPGHYAVCDLARHGK